MSVANLAFLFPGQGSQTVGMGRELHDAYSVARATFEEADGALGYSLSKLCFSGPADQLKQTEFTQPALLTTSVAAARVLLEKGVTPAMAAGHSLGEYSAHVLAGTLPLPDAVRIVRERGRYMQEAVPAGQGAMAAVLGLPLDRISDLCQAASDEWNTMVVPANMNAPEQTVISGEAKAVARASELCKEAGAKRVIALAVSAPFHCRMMLPAAERLASDLERIAFEDARFPVASNVDARMVTRRADVRDCLIRQVTGAVRWTECIQLLRKEGATVFVEIGPGRVLTGLLRQIDRELTGLNVEDNASLERTLATLAAA